MIKRIGVVSFLVLAMAELALAGPARLFEPVPPFRAIYADAATALASDDADLFGVPSSAMDQAMNAAVAPREKVLFRQVVKIDNEAIQTGSLTINLDGKEHVAHLVASYHREDGRGESFFYAMERPDGEEELWSTFTTFYDGSPAYAFVVADGRSYFISPEGNHHVVKRSLKPLVRENLRFRQAAPSASAKSVAADALKVTTNRTRAVRSGWTNRIPLVVDVNVGVVNPYGLTDRTEVAARVTHYFDRQNATFRNSGDPNYVYCREIAYISIPGTVPFDGYWGWARTDPQVEAIRARNLAAGSIILLGSNVRFEASLNVPGVFPAPSDQIILAGGYWRRDSDTDVLNVLHEVGGHFLGRNHDLGHTSSPFATPQSHDWTSCERMQHGPTAYADCGGFMETVEVYSGLRAQKMGYPIDLSIENSVAVSAVVGAQLAKDFK